MWLTRRSGTRQSLSDESAAEMSLEVGSGVRSTETGTDAGAASLRTMARRPARWTVAAVGLVLLAMFVHMLVTSSSLQWSVVGHYFTSSDILIGLVRTLYLTAIAMALGIVGGTVLALMRLARSFALSGFAAAYIWLFRGTPLLVQILFWYNIATFVPRISLGVPFGPSFVGWNTNSLVTTLVAAVLALGLNEAAYMCEIVRAGIVSVDSGQVEAALALGMTRRLAFRRIVLPQAMRVIIPPTGNQTIGMLKGTSLVSVISLPELLYSVQLIYARNFETIPLLVVASLWYLIVTTVLSVGQHFVERRFARGRLRSEPQGLVARLRGSMADLQQVGQGGDVL
jgi:polar amino acid transport system permease protein